ncbi:hypothetical protein KOR42_54030 [Thalassoglobus neptunius]|uniref:Uncharacterized protein n=1 Tax=Thalassoglobus neptunius TaxID=1938619 RepID=A0A5C5UZN4_9PLAN|nr:hypothetical protein [Thalassoglobus neptunius]TWT30952.1 hypothetical protein KOR42_54030 [Thalassoglobus neptunius]
MPALDLSQNIFDLDAEAQLGDWADAAVAASLDIRAQGQLKRGVNLELGVGVMAQLEAHFHKFLAADATIRAEAEAGLKGQIQAPIDLFGEAGVAIRLAAIARASISARLGIGLSIGDFIALAEQDPRMEGIWLRLFTIFMEELSIGAGIRASAAYSAMAFARLGVTGRLVKDPVTLATPGFTIGAEWGVGLKGGTSWQLFAHLGFRDTRRLIRRMVDAVVDEAVYEIGKKFPDSTSKLLLSELRAPAKIAFRSAFELGLTIAESSPTFADSAPELAKQCVRVGLEELQRFILEKLTELAIDLFKEGLARTGLGADAWERSEPQRQHFADHLRAFPAEPYETTVANGLYWAQWIESGVSVGLELGNNSIPEDCVEPLATTWAATQLLFSSVQQLTDASVRASVLGSISVSAQTPSFQGPLAVSTPPPTLIYEFIADAVSAPAGIPLHQDHLVDFLLRDQLLDTLIRRFPELKPALEIVAGPDSQALVAAAQTIMRNIGSFAPNPNTGQPDAEASLRALSQGLRSYLNVRVKTELAPSCISNWEIKLSSGSTLMKC